MTLYFGLYGRIEIQKPHQPLRASEDYPVLYLVGTGATPLKEKQPERKSITRLHLVQKLGYMDLFLHFAYVITV
jgi:hypothetical protein